MGLLVSKNGPAFIISSLIGFVVARYLFEGAWAAYAYILISYHLFLVWLVITAEHETGFSLPILSTICNPFSLSDYCDWHNSWTTLYSILRLDSLPHPRYGVL